MEFVCKCGKRISKSTRSVTTGNVLKNYPNNPCFGCPYIVEHYHWGTGELEKAECRMTKEIKYKTYWKVGIADKDYSIAYLYTLDIELARKMYEFLRDSEPQAIQYSTNWEINEVPKKWRAADFDNANGLIKFPIYFTNNKKGTKARKELVQWLEKECILSDSEEKEKIFKIIFQSKVSAVYKGITNGFLPNNTSELEELNALIMNGYRYDELIKMGSRIYRVIGYRRSEGHISARLFNGYNYFSVNKNDMNQYQSNTKIIKDKRLFGLTDDLVVINKIFNFKQFEIEISGIKISLYEWLANESFADLQSLINYIQMQYEAAVDGRYSILTSLDDNNMTMLQLILEKIIEIVSTNKKYLD